MKTLHQDYFERYGRFGVPVITEAWAYYGSPIFMFYVVSQTGLIGDYNASNGDFFYYERFLDNDDYKPQFQSPLDTDLGKSLYE